MDVKILYKNFIFIFTVFILFIYFGLVPSWINNSFYSSPNKDVIFIRLILSGIIFFGFILTLIILRNRFKLLNYTKSFLLGFIVSSLILGLLWLTKWLDAFVNTTSAVWGIILLIFFLTFPFIITVSLLKVEFKYKILTFPKILVAIVLLNLITWLIWGRSSTLVLTNTSNVHTYYYKEILIEKGFSDNLPFYEVSFNDYSESAKNELIEKLGINKTKVVNRIDWQSDSLDFEETPVFWVAIIRDFPLLSTISYGIIAGGGSVDFKSFYVWFFGWFEIRDELTGIS